MADRKPVRSEPAASADEMPDVHIYGPPVSDYTIFPSSTVQLMCGLGEIEGEDVLVPYLQLSILRATDLSGEGERIEALKATVPFENLAFLLMDMSSDLSRAATKLDRLGAGLITPDARRLAYSVDCMMRARESLAAAMTTLDRLATPSSAEAAAPGADGAAAPKTKAKAGRRTAPSKADGGKRLRAPRPAQKPEST